MIEISHLPHSEDDADSEKIQAEDNELHQRTQSADTDTHSSRESQDDTDTQPNVEDCDFEKKEVKYFDIIRSEGAGRQQVTQVKRVHKHGVTFRGNTVVNLKCSSGRYLIMYHMYCDKWKVNPKSVVVDFEMFQIYTLEECSKRGHLKTVQTFRDIEEVVIEELTDDNIADIMRKQTEFIQSDHEAPVRSSRKKTPIVNDEYEPGVRRTRSQTKKTSAESVPVPKATRSKKTTKRKAPPKKTPSKRAKTVANEDVACVDSLMDSTYVLPVTRVESSPYISELTAAIERMVTQQQMLINEQSRLNSRLETLESRPSPAIVSAPPQPSLQPVRVPLETSEQMVQHVMPPYNAMANNRPIVFVMNVQSSSSRLPTYPSMLDNFLSYLQ